MQANAARHKSVKVIKRVDKININIYNNKTTLTVLGNNEGNINNPLLFRKWLDQKSRGINFRN